MSSASPDPDVLVRVENLSKKFCRSLKKSLWYGVTDVASALNPFSSAREAPSTKHQAPRLRVDEFWAVQNVSFELRRGECLGLIGHNGAGKSTLLKVLNGLIPPDSGSITMKGRVCALIELNAGFNPILSGRENIFNQAALLGFSREETLTKLDAIVEFAEIGDFLDMPVQNYSSGMRVRLGFAVAAQMEPDVLIIDEVLAVGDVAFRFKCLNAIGEIMKSAAVIFVTHTMPQVFRICNEVMVLDHGMVTYSGSDLADGVGVYLSLFKGTEQNVSGSRDLSVSSLEIYSGENSATMGGTVELRHGAALVLRAKLKTKANGPRKARVQFLLWNAEMLPVLDILSDELHGYVFDFPDSGLVELAATVDALPLNAGKYSLSIIAISVDEKTVFLRHDNAAYVQVNASSSSGASALNAASWKIIS
jgi:lipopolysaccharide transport system ATP-binding protein